MPPPDVRHAPALSPVPTAPAQAAQPPTRVLFLDTRDHTGGHINVHLSLIRHFDPSRTRAFAIANTAAPDFEQIQRTYQGLPGLEFRAFPFGDPVSQLRGPSRKIGGLASLARSLARTASCLRDWRIDVIHANEHRSNAALSTILARLTRRANVVHVHSPVGPWMTTGSLFGFRHATAVFAVSDDIRQRLIEIGTPEHKIHVVYNGIDVDAFVPERFAPARDEVRRRHGIPIGAPLVGIVARIVPYKGQRELIEAVSALKPKYPELRLAVIGGSATPDDESTLGEEEKLLRRRVQELGLSQNVLFLGWHADVRPLVTALDIFALPSYGEPFGLAIIEAMALQIPTIACRSGAGPEIIEHGKTGWLVEPRSAADLAQAIDYLLSHPDERHALGRNGRPVVCSCFTAAMQAERVSTLYAALTAKRAQ